MSSHHVQLAVDSLRPGEDQILRQPSLASAPLFMTNHYTRGLKHYAAPSHHVRVSMTGAGLQLQGADRLPHHRFSGKLRTPDVLMQHYSSTVSRNLQPRHSLVTILRPLT
jgi:hypothetical protein